MPRLIKSDLFARFEEAIRLSGWNILYLSPLKNPARYKIYKDGQSFILKLYIYNITPGGKNRPLGEFRIQPTIGSKNFEPETQAKNLVLGWHENMGIFSGWDVRQHSGEIGKSSSFQINEATLHRAVSNRFASYEKGNGETAIAFRSDFIGTYITHLEALHDSGAVPAEAGLLAKLSDDPAAVNDRDIENDIDERRRFAILATRRALRALDFRGRVLNAYGHRCAMCGVQLRLVDSAHILPAAHPDSTDRTSNGVALCALHHRAYDRGLVTFDAALEIHLNVKRMRIFQEADRAEGISSFRKALRPALLIPPNEVDRPAVDYVNEANALRGWSLR